MNAFERIKFGLSLMFPADKHEAALRECFAALNEANRQLFPDNEALREVLAGVIMNFDQEPNEENRKPPAAISWCFAIADDLLLALPKVAEYSSEAAPHGKNWQTISAGIFGAGLGLDQRALTTSELSTFCGSDKERRTTAAAYIRSEIANGRLVAHKSIEDDPTSTYLIAVPDARHWLLKPSRGSRAKSK